MFNKQTIKVSVVIPVYNVQEYLDKCVRSVLSQTIEGLEILFVDDGSTDNSLDILKKYQQLDARIRILSQTNQGAGNARNRAIENAGGEFVCFLDADDYWLEDTALEKLYDCAISKSVKICGGQYYIEKKGKIRSSNVYRMLGDKLNIGEKIEYAAYQYDFNYTNYIYDRDMLIKNHIFFPPYRSFEDPPFFVRAMSAAEWFCIMDVPFYCYRVGYKEIHYTEEIIVGQMQGMIDNLLFSKKRKFKKLHRLTYYRMLEICDRILTKFIVEKCMGLAEKLSEANRIIEWEWLEEKCIIKERVLKPLISMSEEEKNVFGEKWPIPIEYLEVGSRIVLYGAGEVGRCYYRQIQNNGNLYLCAWVDKNYGKITETDYKLRPSKDLLSIQFDYVIIGVAEILTAMEIMDDLAMLGIPAGKIVWDIGI